MYIGGLLFYLIRSNVLQGGFIMINLYKKYFHNQRGASILKIDYNLTEEDYLNFNLYHAKNSKTVAKSLLIQRFLSPIIFLIAAFIFSWIDDVSLVGSLITFSIIGILWIVYYPKYFYRLIIRNSKKMFKEGKNDGLLGEHCMMLSDEGIVDANPNGETKVKWAGIKRFEEDDKYLYIYNSAVSAYIIPKRALTNVVDVQSYVKAKLI